MSDSAAVDPLDETLYQQSLEQLRSPRPPSISSALFTILTIVFVAGAFMDLRSVSGVVILVAVILFHEAGHALGMRLFGFRNVRMFFIPFFGAAVSGNARGAAAWKEAIVTLLGPLPGIVLGTVLLLMASYRAIPDPLAYRIGESFLWLNVFNLLPLGFLDGGRFLEGILFSRTRVLQILFRLLGYGVLAWLAIQGRMWVLGLFVLLSLRMLPLDWRLLTGAGRVRRQLPQFAPDPGQLGEAESRALYDEARSAIGYPGNERPNVVAAGMQSVLDALKKPPGWLATIGLLGIYAAGVFVGVIGTSGVMLLNAPQHPHPVATNDWRAEFPAGPLHFRMADPESTEIWRAVLNGTERFTIEASRGGTATGWMLANADSLARLTKLSPVAWRPVSIAAHEALEFEFKGPGRRMVARMLAVGGRRYVVSASAPAWGESQRRFLQSFTLTDSASSP